jgi:hypothetical protein
VTYASYRSTFRAVAWSFSGLSGVRVPSGTPGGNPYAPIKFMPVEEPPAPEQSPARRKGGGILWCI